MPNRLAQSTPRPALLIFTIYIVALIVLLPFVAHRGQDINYDLMNYHLFSADNILHGGGFGNVVNEQQFLAPYIYLPFYVLEKVFGPKHGALLLSALQALNIALVAVLAHVLLKPFKVQNVTRALMIAACALVAGSSPMFLTELGTSFADVLVTIPVLGGLIFWCLSMRTDAARSSIWLAGILLGIATGLKLTAAIYPLSMVVATLASGPRGQRIVNSVRLIGGSTLGFVVAGGWWAYRLWANFGSPLFPFYNNIFKSKFYPATTFVDTRFLPTSFGDALSYPFQWVLGLHPSSESSFRDARFAVIFLGLGLLLAALLWRKIRPSVPADRDDAGETGLASFASFLIFFAVAFVLWIKLFAIQRYLVGLELVAGVAVMGLAALIARSMKQSARVATLVLAVAIAGWTLPSDFGHSEWSEHMASLDVIAPLKGNDALYFFVDKPMSYLVPQFGRNNTFKDIGMYEDGGNAMGAELSDLLRVSPLPKYAITGSLLNERMLKVYNQYGLRQSGQDCIYLPASIGARPIGLGACPLFVDKRAFPTRAAVIELGRPIKFSAPANSLYYATAGWGAENEKGRIWPADAKNARITLELKDAPPPKLNLTLKFGASYADCKIRVSINGKPLATRENPCSSGENEFSVAIPDGVIGPDGYADIVFEREKTDVAPTEYVIREFTLSAN